MSDNNAAKMLEQLDLSLEIMGKDPSGPTELLFDALVELAVKVLRPVLVSGGTCVHMFPDGAMMSVDVKQAFEKLLPKEEEIELAEVSNFVGEKKTFH